MFLSFQISNQLLNIFSAQKRTPLSSPNRQLQPGAPLLQPTPDLQRDLRGHHPQPRPQVVFLSDDWGHLTTPRKGPPSSQRTSAQEKCLRHRRIFRLSERS